MKGQLKQERVTGIFTFMCARTLTQNKILHSLLVAPSHDLLRFMTTIIDPSLLVAGTYAPDYYESFNKYVAAYDESLLKDR